jgi:hypothetical protein
MDPTYFHSCKLGSAATAEAAVDRCDREVARRAAEAAFRTPVAQAPERTVVGKDVDS